MSVTQLEKCANHPYLDPVQKEETLIAKIQVALLGSLAVTLSIKGLLIWF